MAGGVLPSLPIGLAWSTEPAPTIVVCDSRVNAAFTTRLGGVSRAPLNSLNLSRGPHLRLEAEESDADRATNIKRAREFAGINPNCEWVVVRQVHGTRIVEAKEAAQTRLEADGIRTSSPAFALCVKSADCLNLLCVGEAAIVCAHAGWRGVVAGMVAKASENSMVTYAGPAIGPCCFKVGPEVEERFRSLFGSASNPEAGIVDLWRAASVHANDKGSEFIAARVCTSCHPELYFSHRRDDGRTGGHGLVAALADG